MNQRLIRAAIALYPPDWRKRYGGELEQATVDACEASSGSFTRTRLLVGLAFFGLRQRIGGRLGRYGSSIIGVLTTTAAAVAAVMVFFVGDQPSVAPLIPPTPDTLAPGAHIDPRLKETHDTSSMYSASPEIILGPGSGSRNIVAVAGARVTVHVDPTTDQVTSIRVKKQ
jgi:hypothetical protein